MWFGVLGPLEARDGRGEAIRLLGPLRRQLLAALLCRAGRTVASTVLVEDLWGDAPPRSAAKTLQSHVARLRDDLGSGAGSVVVTEPTGYRLQIGAGDFDAASFEHLIADVGVDGAVMDTSTALQKLDSALQLWRGEAYADFGDVAFAVGERLRLAELRVLAKERRTDLALELGQTGSLIADLEQQVLVEPYRERGWEQLILALYRCGRQAEALSAYARARDGLAAELGVDPGPGLRALEQRILRHDQDLLVTGRREEMTLEAADQPKSLDSPYRGLAGYREQDAALFVGRERLTSDVVSLLSEHPVVAVTGASGSGKSSLLRAGVMATLRRGGLPGSASWRLTVTTPSEFDGTTASDVLVLDQAEELFTVLDATARAALAETLINRIETGQRLVIGIRGDFYSRLAEVPSFAAYVRPATVLVGPMRDDEVLRIVQEPSAWARISVEPAMLEAVLDEVHGQVGALPMLSAALSAAWDHRESGMLTLAGYRRGGGVARAIETGADHAYEGLDDEEQRAARGLLVRLARLEKHAGWVRTPLPNEEAREQAPPQVIQALADARLLAVSADRVEISHEALLTEWPRLAGWLADRADAAELLDHLRGAERGWRSAGRTDADLYRGARLQEALDRRAAHPEDFSAAESEFLDASQVNATRELDLARQRAEREAAGRRRLRRVVLVLAAAVVLAAAAAFIAVQERATARRQAQRASDAALAADARKVSAEALTAPDLRTSLLLAAAAYRLQNSPDTSSGLLSALERFGAPRYRIATANRLQWVDVNRAGTALWAMDNLGQVIRFDARTRSSIGTFPLRADHVVAMSPDSRLLVAVGQADQGDQAGATRAIVLDAVTGDLVRVLPIHALRNGTAFRSAVFTGDGRWLAAMESDPSDPDTPIATLAIFDARHFGLAPRTVRFPAQVVGVAAGAHEIAVQTADGGLRVLDAATLRVVAKGARPALRVPPDERTRDISFVGLSPDGGRLAVVIGENVVQLISTRDLSSPAVASQSLSSYVDAMSFSPTGDLVAAGTGTGEVDVLRAADGSLAARETGNDGQVMSVTWSGNTAQDEQLYAGGLDSQIVAYTVRQLSPELDFGRTETAIGDLHLTHRYLVGVRPAEGTARESEVQLVVSDPSTRMGRSYPLRLGDGDNIEAFSFDRSGSHLLMTVRHGSGRISCQLYDLRTGHVMAAFTPTTSVSPDQTYVGALSADGRTAVVSVGERTLASFDLPSGRRRSTTQVTFRGASRNRTLAVPLAFGPDGRLLVWGFDPGYTGTLPVPGPTSRHLPVDLRPPTRQQVESVDVRTGKDRGDVLLGARDFPIDPAWSPDGRLLALGTNAGTLSVVRAATLRPVEQPVPAASSPVNTVAFSPDGRTVVTGGADAELSLWDAATVRRIGPPIRTGDNATYAWFDQQGDITGYAEQLGENQQQRIKYPGRPVEWVAAACATAGDDLSRGEWARYVTDRPYRATCG